MLSIKSILNFLEKQITNDKDLRNYEYIQDKSQSKCNLLTQNQIFQHFPQLTVSISI